MLSLVWLSMLMMMKMMKAGEVITVHKSSGDSVVLPSGRLRGTAEVDYRWTHLHLLLNNKTTSCHHGRCELLSDGSLRFSRVQAEDSGTYTLEVFDEAGNKEDKKVFVLQVTETSSSVSSLVIIPCFLLLFLLLLFIILFILWRRRTQRTMSSGQTEENVYVVMHGNHGKKGKHEGGEGHQKQEESLGVPFSPALPVEQTEDIYV